MIIAKEYSELLANSKQLSDEKYLELQLNELVNMFYAELSAIKNHRLKYVAFSNSYAEHFNLSDATLNKQAEPTASISADLTAEILKQEQEILTTQKTQKSFFHTKSNNNNSSYLIRKLPLINPSTKNAVGILIFANKINPLNLYRLVAKYFLNKNSPPAIESKKEFSTKQATIVSCILLGFHQRKEIAGIISKVTANNLNDIQIRNSLQTLYERYNCSTTHELIAMISADEELKEISANYVSDSSDIF